jgi:hypothetical protein
MKQVYNHEGRSYLILLKKSINSFIEKDRVDMGAVDMWRQALNSDKVIFIDNNIVLFLKAIEQAEIVEE